MVNRLIEAFVLDSQRVTEMKVQVRLYASLRKHLPDMGHGEAAFVELPDGATVGDLLHTLDIPDRDAKQCFVNAVARGQDHVLKDGDEVGCFPPVAGG